MNSNLHAAKKAKNDEFYTQLSDIENELRHYKAHFKGKTVFLNCDDPLESNFYVYFAQNFEHLGLKKLISTHYRDDQPTYKLEIIGDGNNDGKINALDTIKTPLKQNGDFRSDECIAILEEADIVVTNPPFSLFREYTEQLMNNNKKFLIVGPLNAVSYKETFRYIKENRLWLGAAGRLKKFTLPGGEEKSVPSVWYTNLEHKKRTEDIILYKTHSPDFNLKFDEYDAIDIATNEKRKTEYIPVDYYGKMGVPVSFLEKYNPNQFELLGIDRYMEDNPNYGKRFKINGKETFPRIIIKRK